MYDFLGLRSKLEKKTKGGRPGKVDLSAFSDFPVLGYPDEVLNGHHKEFLFHTQENGHRYDFILSKKKEKRLFVMFSGSANRLKLNPPVFHRWKWADKFPGSTLYVSDPSLYIHEKLALGWYIGTKSVDHLQVISRVVMEVAESLGVSKENIIGYGSSGGGFASLRMANFIDGMTSVAINPQIIIKNYHERAVNRFLKICFESSFDKFDFDGNLNRFDIRAVVLDKENNKFIVAQNTVDEDHFINHFSHLCNAIDTDSKVDNGRLKTILFSHPSGHKKAETTEVFDRILRLV